MGSYRKTNRTPIQKDKEKINPQIYFCLLSSIGKSILQVLTVLASPVFVDTEVLGNFHCSRSVISFLHIVLVLPLLLLRFSCRLQFCSDSDEQLGLHGSPQLRCFNHSHCQERTYGNKGQIQPAWLPDSPTKRTAKKQQIRKMRERSITLWESMRATREGKKESVDRCEKSPNVESEHTIEKGK